MALIRQVDTAGAGVVELAVATEEAFLAHPDTDIITSFAGLSVLCGARVLAEIGDDRERFADARAMNAYACAAPVTRAFAALRSRAPRAHYDRRRAGGEPTSQLSGSCSTKRPAASTTTYGAALYSPPVAPSHHPWTSPPGPVPAGASGRPQAH
ncbi:transposase [Streptomyces brasiliensis]|uniref:transposase n=1 Tax=Streptomyces brasiliensis TaxID=1954 RepID=UPI0027E4748D|nr:transposase [Streptomyces brasiliensis]